jgi:hypothetical protein
MLLLNLKYYSDYGFSRRRWNGLLLYPICISNYFLMGVTKNLWFRVEFEKAYLI